MKDVKAQIQSLMDKKYLALVKRQKVGKIQLTDKERDFFDRLIVFWKEMKELKKTHD